MSRSMKSHPSASRSEARVEVKSCFDAEFRRFSIARDSSHKFEEFCTLLETLHRIPSIPFTITYTDPKDGDELPINNDDNFAKAVETARPSLRLTIRKRGEGFDDLNSSVSSRKGLRSGGLLSSLLNAAGTPSSKNKLSISYPEDFRTVSQIIDVDIVPPTCRRVRLRKHEEDKPLGFYIRDGTSVRVTPDGLEKVPGIFISRIVPGGLAESTGLLEVNDEVLEVNGIEVAGKSLDQVTDMMMANSANLIITTRPANQQPLTTATPRRGSFSRSSQFSSGSGASAQSGTGSDDDQFDVDEVKDHLAASALHATPGNHHNAGNH
ncbi:unnamed protein product [Cyprideis torosa]|uniref:Uncharacterized protein n=1 Tax=Cyprideis torosa TaxID=163714 RepID=A0A7R8ZWB0_9CRUS|nr:unnamed protein product [Cyprideis torosa]CAG0904562.1 unnamed protein product [Cyprideis torosa]